MLYAQTPDAAFGFVFDYFGNAKGVSQSNQKVPSLLHNSVRSFPFLGACILFPRVVRNSDWLAFRIDSKPDISLPFQFDFDRHVYEIVRIETG